MKDYSKYTKEDLIEEIKNLKIEKIWSQLGN